MKKERSQIVRSSKKSVLRSHYYQSASSTNAQRTERLAQKHTVDAAVIFGVVGDLCVLGPNDFAGRGD
jgi:hypothetical protein